MNGEREAIHKAKTIEEATNIAITRLVNHGEAIVRLSLSDREFLSEIKNEIISRNCILSSFNLMRKQGEDEGWQNVERATFFTGAHLKGATIKQKIGAVIFPSILWLPTTRKSAFRAAETLRNVNNAENGPNLESLKSYKPNRIGINKMKGSEHEEAFIAPHTDPQEEVGAVIVLDLYRPGIEKGLYLSEDNMKVIFSKNTCDEIGVDQPIHEVESPVLRLSTTFAELLPRP